MAYKEPETAIHHLRMAQSYLDDADKLGDKEKKASLITADKQIQILAQAAAHLNKARVIDPNEVLWREDEKEKTKYKVDQDRLNGEVLLSEGVAHLNAALDVSNTYSPTNDSSRAAYAQGITRLTQARDALEKSLQYRPFSDQTFKFLARTYERLGDMPNYRRILEQHVEISPENIELHKQLKALGEAPPEKPLFVQPARKPVNFKLLLWLGIPLGMVVSMIGGASNINWLGGMGALIFAGSIGMLFLVRWASY